MTRDEEAKNVPKSHTSYHADTGLVSRVPARAHEHGQKVYYRGMVLQQRLVPRQYEPRAALECQQAHEPVGPPDLALI